MIWLAAFGSPLANRLGAARFVLFWVATSVAAAAMHYVLHMTDQSPLVGASGAISGMMGAAARFGFRIDRSSGQGAFGGPVLPVSIVLRSPRRRRLSSAIWMVSIWSPGWSAGGPGTDSRDSVGGAYRRVPGRILWYRALRPWCCCGGMSELPDSERKTPRRKPAGPRFSPGGRSLQVLIGRLLIRSGCWWWDASSEAQPPFRRRSAGVDDLRRPTPTAAFPLKPGDEARAFGLRQAGRPGLRHRRNGDQPLRRAWELDERGREKSQTRKGLLQRREGDLRAAQPESSGRSATNLVGVREGREWRPLRRGGSQGRMATGRLRLRQPARRRRARQADAASPSYQRKGNGQGDFWETLAGS